MNRRGFFKAMGGGAVVAGLAATGLLPQKPKSYPISYQIALDPATSSSSGGVVLVWAWKQDHFQVIDQWKI